MTETDIMHAIMLSLSSHGHLVFRGNVGKIRLSDGRFFSTGLPKGFSDLFGATKDGRIFFIEVKTTTGRLREDQKRFLTAMRNRGLLAGVARSPADALAIVEGRQQYDTTRSV